ncbi:LacI family DNA-binding transcriptional regulator [Shigella sonnei]|nr:LacI family DNA-binding transcriptional regulator [Shigella sonnei]
MVNVKPVTLYDVAEYAGVSYQTVSRVVNQASHVSAKTRGKSGSGDGGAELHSQPRGTTTGGQTVVADWRCHLQSGPARAVANCRGD